MRRASPGWRGWADARPPRRTCASRDSSTGAGRTWRGPRGPSSRGAATRTVPSSRRSRAACSWCGATVMAAAPRSRSHASTVRSGSASRRRSRPRPTRRSPPVRCSPPGAQGAVWAAWTERTAGRASTVTLAEWKDGTWQRRLTGLTREATPEGVRALAITTADPGPSGPGLGRAAREREPPARRARRGLRAGRGAAPGASARGGRRGGLRRGGSRRQEVGADRDAAPAPATSGGRGVGPAREDRLRERARPACPVQVPHTSYRVPGSGATHLVPVQVLPGSAGFRCHTPGTGFVPGSGATHLVPGSAHRAGAGQVPHLVPGSGARFGCWYRATHLVPGSGARVARPIARPSSGATHLVPGSYRVQVPHTWYRVRPIERVPGSGATHLVPGSGAGFGCHTPGTGFRCRVQVPHTWYPLRARAVPRPRQADGSSGSAESSPSARARGAAHLHRRRARAATRSARASKSAARHTATCSASSSATCQGPCPTVASTRDELTSRTAGARYPRRHPRPRSRRGRRLPGSRTGSAGRASRRASAVVKSAASSLPSAVASP